MKLKRFTAPDMRQALSKIRAELGAEAVIMSNKRVAGGVEIVAGVEEGAIPGRQAAAPRERRLKDDEVSLGSARGPAKKEGFAQSLIEILERQRQQGNDAPAQGLRSAGKPAPAAPAPAEPSPAPARRAAPPEPLSARDSLKSLYEAAPAAGPRSAPVKDPPRRAAPEAGVPDNLNRVRSDLEAIRRLLQFELAGLLSDRDSREEPVRAMAASLLSGAGFDQELCRELTAGIDADASFNFAWRQLNSILTGRLNVGQDEIIRHGGIVTLLGPAGVGKTTTIAKLAARFVMKYGPERLAIVSADHYRIGAVEQIKTYGRIMGCAALAIKSPAELPELLKTLGDKSLVLVDTVGVGLKDERFGTQLAQLKSQSRLKLKHYLVLQASSQRRVLEQILDCFNSVELSGLILTKTDECSSLADALSVCLKRKLRLSYVASGQRVPEDLAVPNACELVTRLLDSIERQ